MISPRARASGDSAAAATYAPRSLNAPIGWRDSALSHWRRSGRPNGTSGVRTAIPRSTCGRGPDLGDADELDLRLDRLRLAHRRLARWQSMHSAAHGSASSRPSGIGWWQDVHDP